MGGRIHPRETTTSVGQGRETWVFRKKMNFALTWKPARCKNGTHGISLGGAERKKGTTDYTHSVGWRNVQKAEEMAQKDGLIFQRKGGKAVQLSHLQTLS